MAGDVDAMVAPTVTGMAPEQSFLTADPAVEGERTLTDPDTDV